jgi:hypothetical protein
MTLSPGSHDLTIYQGATFQRILTWKNSDGQAVNLTGYTARMMARASIDSATALITLTTENGGIALGGAAGTINLSISAANTATLSQNGVYDLELINASGVVTRLLEGNLFISREVTR